MTTSTHRMSVDLFFRLFGEHIIDRDTFDTTYFAHLDAVCLMSILSAVKPRRFLEIGINEGRTARLILEHVPSITEYVGVDVPPDHRCIHERQTREVPAEAGCMVRSDSRVKLVIRPNGSFDVHPDELGTFDAVFIDGDHAREAVLNDTKLARAVANPGGVILYHDCNGAENVADVLEVVDELNRAEGGHIVVTGVGLGFQWEWTLP